METEQSVNSNPDTGRRLDAERIQLLFRQSSWGNLASIVSGLLLAFLLRHHIDRDVLRTWLSAIVLLSLFRGSLLYLFNRRSPDAGRLNVWKWLNIASLAASGVVWGSSVIFLFPPDSLAHIFFMAAVLSSMVAGAAMAFSIIMRAFMAYTLPCLLPLIVRLSMMPGELPQTMAVLAVVYLTFSIFIAVNIRRTRLELLRLKDDLSQRVARRTADLEEANRRLKEEIEERSRAEQESRRLSEQLEQARKFEAIATLAGGIAHQFNNALAVIVGNIELLRISERGLPGVRERVDPIMISAIQMTQLTDQLLAYAKGGKYKAKWTETESFLRGAIEAVRHGLRPQIELEVNIESGLPPIRIDATQMQMVVAAVVANAIEAIQNKGRIQVECRGVQVEPPLEGIPPAGQVMIRVSDSGVGMSSETLARIFDPFFSTKFQGRGLAMAAVYGIIQNHTGQITVESELGRGTVVTIHLPAGTAEAAALPPEVRQELTPGSGTVLLVEDEEMVREVNRAILERLGYSVTEAANGAQAVARIDEAAFDLVLLDIKLPDMDGGAILKEIKRRRPECRVIVCSGYSLDGAAQGMLAAGAAAFVQKPFSLSLMAAKLSEVMGSR